jgi:hypothetical protein
MLICLAPSIRRRSQPPSACVRKLGRAFAVSLQHPFHRRWSQPPRQALLPAITSSIVTPGHACKQSRRPMGKVEGDCEDNWEGSKAHLAAQNGGEKGASVRIAGSHYFRDKDRQAELKGVPPRYSRRRRH